MRHQLRINRAPVLTLWGDVVAEHLGYDRDAALTLGRAVAGLNAQSKGQHLHLFEKPKAPTAAEAQRRARQPKQKRVPLLGRSVPVVQRPEGLRAVAGGRPVKPAAVERYLEQKFGAAVADARAAMDELASAYEPDELAQRAYDLYEKFRPEVPAGARGWGAKGTLDLDAIRKLA
ncbi:MAG TPA: hypothetical protein VFS33_01050 [Gemmatimonadales bacterium]|nr:hypothetical protein [Gemmatimonadales bacterium]